MSPLLDTSSPASPPADTYDLARHEHRARFLADFGPMRPSTRARYDQLCADGAVVERHGRQCRFPDDAPQLAPPGTAWHNGEAMSMEEAFERMGWTRHSHGHWIAPNVEVHQAQ